MLCILPGLRLAIENVNFFFQSPRGMKKKKLIKSCLYAKQHELYKIKAIIAIDISRHVIRYPTKTLWALQLHVAQVIM